jgi:hypothetical protein
MLQIEFEDLDTQNAIYSVACKYENFPVVEDEENVMEYFWKQVSDKGEIGYGLEKAISDFILMQNDFDVLSGKYGYIPDDYEMEVIRLKHYND